MIITRACKQIAFVDTETGEVKQRWLVHREEAETFYRDQAAQGRQVRVGMEASGHARWFERLLAELTKNLSEYYGTSQSSAYTS